MYNLLIGANYGIYQSRMLEYTEAEIKAFFSGGKDYERLQRLPTLVMPEIGDDDAAPYAELGRVENLRMDRDGRLRYTFTRNPAVAPIPMGRIAELIEPLGIENHFLLSHTHWAVKDVDVYDAILGEQPTHDPSTRAVSFPRELPQEHDLVVVMMPFEGFDSVYNSIRAAVEDAGLRCLRADDIWENHHIMDDVLSLIWRAGVVVSDLSGKNANVFYETGLAHAIGRDVVLITRAMSDVPFDLRSIRALPYLPNGEGLTKLRTDLAKKLKTLTTRVRQ